MAGGPHLGNSLRQGSTRSINSSRSTASVTAAFNEHGYDNQFDDDDAPAPPGLNERSKLLGTNKIARHSRPAATKRGSTIAHAIIASVAGETGGSAAAGGASHNPIVGASVLGSVAGVTATDVRGKLHLWRKANENGGASGAGDGQSS